MIDRKKKIATLIVSASVMLTAFAVVGVGRQEVTGAVLSSIKAYEVSSDASSASYGTYNFSEHGGSDSSVTGILIDLAEGDTFRYNKAIDVSGLTMNDIIYTLVLTPSAYDVSDVYSIEIMLTDAYDSNNAVYFKANQTGYGQDLACSYTSAKTTGQPYTGWEWGFNKKHVEAPFGTVALFSFGGIYPTDDIADNALKVSLDDNTKKIANQTSGGSIKHLCDFDNPDDFADIWNGFTTGEVFFSMRVLEYDDSSVGHFCLTSLYGVDLTMEKFVPESGVIKVDTLGYGENLPTGETGKQYPVYPAVCYDPYVGAALDIKTEVFFAYGSATEQRVPVVNDKFTPERAGEYAIRYSATNEYGVESTKNVVVNVSDSLGEIAIEFNGQYATAGKTGKYVDIADETVTGSSGNYVLDTKIIFEGERIEPENGRFFPEKAGVYEVIYKVEDFVGRTTEKRYTVSITANPNPVFIDTVSLPKFFIDGAEYTLPSAVAYDYSVYPAKTVEAKITLTDENGEINVRNNKIIPFVDKTGDTVQINYTAKSSSGSTVLSFDVVCIKNDNFSISNFFYGERIKTVKNGDYYETFTANEDEIFFINPVGADGFSAKFKVSASEFSVLNFYLTDASDSSIRIKINYNNRSSNAECTLNDGGESVKAGKALYNQSVTFTLGFDNKSGRVIIDSDNNVYLQAKKTLYGTEFCGFPSGKVYLSYSFDGITEKAGLVMTDICGQPLNNVISEDEIAPKLSFLGEFSKNAKENAMVLIPKAVVWDVLDYNSTATLTVRNPDGEIMTANDGTKLQNVAADMEYYITVKGVGNYVCIYQLKDATGNKKNAQYIIEVADEDGPELITEARYKEKYNKGDTIYMYPFTMADFQATSEAYLLLMTPSGKQVSINNQTYFIAAEQGKYRIVYFLMDKIGNCSYYSFEINVV